MSFSPAHPVKILDKDGALALLRCGGIVIYPTETFYALGCLVANKPALDSICRCKERPAAKPLPLVAASLDQVRLFCDTANVPPALFSLWPAPVTLVLPPLPGTVFPSCLCNSEGLIAVRVSPHPTPTLLSEASGMFLTASSANLRGNPPVTNPSDLDPALLSRLASLHYPIGLLPHEQGFAPLGYKPSTILKPCSASYPSQTTVDVLRLGAFSLDDLKKTGLSFSLEKKELF